MKQIFFLILSITLLAGCAFNSRSHVENSTLFIQVISDSESIKKIISESGPIIDGIIKKELSLAASYDVTFFYPKDRQRISVYSLNEFNQSGESLLFSSLDDINIIDMMPKHISATANLQFFGDKQDELVLIVGDKKKELEDINFKIKTKLHKLNDQYKAKEKTQLYNIEKSERHHYLPHMGLGRISLREINKHIKKADAEDTINRIREQIKEEIGKFIEKNISSSPRLPVSKISIWDLTNRKYIKEWKK